MPLVVAAGLLFLVAQITGSLDSIYSTAMRWFSPDSFAQLGPDNQAKAAGSSPSKPGCGTIRIIGGEISGFQRAITIPPCGNVETNGTKFHDGGSAVEMRSPGETAQTPIINNQGGIYAPGQLGGQNTINNFAPPPPQWRVVQDLPVAEVDNGTKFAHTKLVQVTAQSSQANIVFMAKGDGVLSIGGSAMRGATMIAGHGTTPDGWHWVAFTTPTFGLFNIGVGTKNKDDPIEFNVIFNADIR